MIQNHDEVTKSQCKKKKRIFNKKNNNSKDIDVAVTLNRGTFSEPPFQKGT